MTRLAAVLLVAALGSTLYAAASQSTGLTGAFSASETSTRPLAASDGLEQRQMEEAGVPSAGLAIVPLARPLSPASAGSSRSPSAATAGQEPPPSQSSRPASCLSPCAVDVSEWDVPTLAPLRPLASDCRLPCYGTARVGPASWYNAGSGYYAAIPGYLGGVVSVAVCTFPDGQANCHTFPVTSSCQCYRHESRERVVDLSPAAFRLFQPDLLRGLVMVQITVLR